jgi:hypothetical protein
MMACTAEACWVQRMTDFETKMDRIVVCAFFMNDSVPTANYTMTLCSTFLKTADHHKKKCIKVISMYLAEYRVHTAGLVSAQNIQNR